MIHVQNLAYKHWLIQSYPDQRELAAFIYSSLKGGQRMSFDLMAEAGVKGVIQSIESCDKAANLVRRQILLPRWRIEWGVDRVNIFLVAENESAATFWRENCEELWFDGMPEPNVVMLRRGKIVNKKQQKNERKRPS